MWRMKESVRLFARNQPFSLSPSHSGSRSDGKERLSGELLILSLQDVQGTSLSSEEASLGLTRRRNVWTLEWNIDTAVTNDWLPAGGRMWPLEGSQTVACEELKHQRGQSGRPL